MSNVWTRLSSLRKAVADKFNAMPYEQRVIGGVSCSVDCIRDLLMMKETFNEIIDKRIKIHQEHIEEWNRKEAFDDRQKG